MMYITSRIYWQSFVECPQTPFVHKTTIFPRRSLVMGFRNDSIPDYGSQSKKFFNIQLLGNNYTIQYSGSYPCSLLSQGYTARISYSRKFLNSPILDPFQEYIKEDKEFMYHTVNYQNSQSRPFKFHLIKITM